MLNRENSDFDYFSAVRRGPVPLRRGGVRLARLLRESSSRRPGACAGRRRQGPGRGASDRFERTASRGPRAHAAARELPDALVAGRRRLHRGQAGPAERPSVVTLPPGGALPRRRRRGRRRTSQLRRFARESFPVALGTPRGPASSSSRGPLEPRRGSSRLERPGPRDGLRPRRWIASPAAFARARLPLVHADDLVRRARSQRGGGPAGAAPPPRRGRREIDGGLRVHPRRRRQHRPQPRGDERAPRRATSGSSCSSWPGTSATSSRSRRASTSPPATPW